jgi:hypothetical protein
MSTFVLFRGLEVPEYPKCICKNKAEWKTVNNKEEEDAQIAEWFSNINHATNSVSDMLIDKQYATAVRKPGRPRKL